MCRLVGHEGSIFRIAWTSDGSKLLSVSDDRSARLWVIHTESKEVKASDALGSHIVGPVLFGHNARIWDCDIFDKLIITGGEDCTCRVWDLDGNQLVTIKEHVGRGLWRCLYDPGSSLLVTGGFDSAIKVHCLQDSLSSIPEGHDEDVKGSINKMKMLAIRIPSPQQKGLMDSKSEYVRCLHFAQEDSLYVATNNGFIYHARLSNKGDVKWTELVRVSKEVPIICMDLLSRRSSSVPSILEDWVAVGDGKGHLTVIYVVSDDCGVKVCQIFTWLAEAERQLLATYWCKELGNRYIFTADPKGALKLWRIGDPTQSDLCCSDDSCSVSLVAEFVSCFGTRIMCLNACLEGEMLVCGDLRGNLMLFPLLQTLLSAATEEKIATLTHFKGAHGISGVCSISVSVYSSCQIEICSTGGDGCICYLEYDKYRKKLEFMGMKQVKELSVIKCSTGASKLVSGSYAVGFSSTNFLIWNLLTETKVVHVPCGGWRRPHSYYLGDVPEIMNRFAFVKDEIIYIHSHWMPNDEKKIYPQSLHVQFHGREIHSMCFISEDSPSSSTWIATGCEDGTVRLTRYDVDAMNWSLSKLLGEHVGGSAVRSLCFASKVHKVAADVITTPYDTSRLNVSFEDRENISLLISVGAKRVLTSWKQRKNIGVLDTVSVDGNERAAKSLSKSSSMSFQWLSTDMPAKHCSTREIKVYPKKEIKADENVENSKVESQSCNTYVSEDDWRYLAVTAFLVELLGMTVCFVVVACSDATLTLRALLLPYRLWFDVAILEPLLSPVLALQHVVVPRDPSPENGIDNGSCFLLFSGSTDGGIAIWNLTESITDFMHSISASQLEKSIDCQKRPRTGRGSQGGRWWRTLQRSVGSEKKSDNTKETDGNMLNGTIACSDESADSKTVESEDVDSSSSEIVRIQPLHVLNGIHQSGVNCLRVSHIQNLTGLDSGSRHIMVVSGGDDQAVNCLQVSLDKNSRMIVTHHERIASAHSSAVKGIWTDGNWVFSTGLDQRVRCWRLDNQGRLTERAHLIVSVPEPEALDVQLYGRDRYQIAVAGRGMQIMEFSSI
ncbi:uncharacterized protein LOC124929581 isoform X2 [Impatiens glandulifera]|nr:uncharacterized protein LOC124929581 isoform X2 [Impatiens glandulifera]